MKRFMLLAAVAVIMLITPVKADNSVELLPLDMEALCSGSVEKMEATCYPSGMQLPTKWLDLSAFIPFDGTFEPEPEVYNLLLANWETGGKYTYPEYFAAKVYIGVTKITQLSEPNDFNLAVKEAVNQGVLPLDQSASITGDAQYIAKLLTVYRGTLEAAAATEFPGNLESYSSLVGSTEFDFIPTLSYDFPWLTAYDGELSPEVVARSREMFDELSNWYTRCGITFSPMENVIRWVATVPQEQSADVSIEYGDNDVTALDRYTPPLGVVADARLGILDYLQRGAIVITVWGVLAALAIAWRKKHG